MRPGADGEPITLSTLEFDVVCESEALTDRRHIVLDVPSPGRTHTERAGLVAEVWPQLRSRQLAESRRDRVDPDFGDLLVLLDRPKLSLDLRIWADRAIRAQAACNGGTGLLTIVDGDVVELTPVRGSSLAEAVISVAGDASPGAGRAVSVPHEVLRDASAGAGQHDSRALTDELRVRGVSADDAATLAAMADGMGMRGQFGVEFAPTRGSKPERAPRVVAFHDTGSGRYLHVVRANGDGQLWSTVAPSSNQLLAWYLQELITETTGD